MIFACASSAFTASGIVAAAPAGNIDAPGVIAILLTTPSSASEIAFVLLRTIVCASTFVESTFPVAFGASYNATANVSLPTGAFMPKVQVELAFSGAVQFGDP